MTNIDLIGLKEVMRITPWRKTKIYELIGAGKLDARRIHGRTYFRRAEVLALLQEMWNAAAEVRRSGRAQAD